MVIGPRCRWWWIVLWDSCRRPAGSASRHLAAPQSGGDDRQERGLRVGPGVLEVVRQVGVEGDAVALLELVALPVADEHDRARARRARSRGCRARASAGRRPRRWRRRARACAARAPRAGRAGRRSAPRSGGRAACCRRAGARPARTIVTAPPSSRRSSCESRSSRPAAIRAATVSVGLVSPRSTCESIGALTPLRSRGRAATGPRTRAAPSRARRSRRASSAEACVGRRLAR